MAANNNANNAVIEGHVHHIGEVELITENFSKREMVVKTEHPQYPEHIAVQAVNTNVTIFNGLSVGEKVQVHVNIKGRPWTNPEGVTRYFNTLTAWRVTQIGQPQQQAQPQSYNNGPDNPEDDLPF